MNSLSLPRRVFAHAAVLLCAGAAAALDLSACTLTASEGRQEIRARCGTLPVPLDPAAADGEAIGLFVAVVPAVVEEPAPDPLTVIAGGPGDASTRFFAQVQGAFEPIRRTRDIVLVDQRGTGKSAPLHCENFRELGPLADVATDIDTVVEMTLECLADLAPDPRFFTTSLAVQDLDRVRAALGYARLNLYGISYGSRVAQHYARRFPERTRSVILDGVVPAAVSLGPDTALESQRALNAMLLQCRADATCQAAFPDLAERFDAVLARLRETPARIVFEHPRTAEPEEVVVDGLVMAGVVRLLLYSPVTTSLLPVLIDAAYRGDYAPLVTQAYLASLGVEDLTIGLNYAIVCAEDEPYSRDFDLEAQRATYLGSTFMEVLGRVCARWPRGPMDDDFHEPLASDAPVLFLTGERDPITPPRYVPLAAERLTNYAELLGPGQGHGMLATGCVPRVMAEFVKTADPAGLDLDCAGRMRAFPLLTSPLGPAP